MMSVFVLRDAARIGTDHRERARLVSRRMDRHDSRQLFARATSRRGRDVTSGVAAAAVIAALWATGAWMTVGVSRALDSANRVEVSTVAQDIQRNILIGATR